MNSVFSSKSVMLTYQSLNQAFALLNFYCNKYAIISIIAMIQLDSALLKYCITEIKFGEKCNNRNGIKIFLVLLHILIIY